MSFKVTIGSFLVATGLLVAGCDAVVYNTPSEITTARAEVERESINLEFDTESLSPEMVQKLAKEYRSKGESPMLVTITYDPHSPNNTARKASDTAARLAASLHTQGIGHLNVDTLPVNESGEQSNTIVSYDALRAVPPSSCDDVLEIGMTTDLERMEEYELGCSVETYIARQVARPGDLLGKDNMGNGEGRYSANALEPYMSGAANPALAGENASD